MSNSIAIGVAYQDQAINGGSVDNTPVGATTASTGAFSTLSATGAATLSGAVSMTGAVSLGADSTIGFYGTSAVAQQAAGTAVDTTAPSQSSPYGFATYAQATGVIELANALRTALVNLGLAA